MKNIKFTLLILFILILSSCDVIYNIDLFIGDIVAATEQEQPIFVSSTLAFEAPSEKNEPKLIDYIKKNFRNVQNIRKKKIDYSEYIYCDIDVPLESGNYGDHNSDLIYLSTDFDSENETYLLNLVLNKTMWVKVNQYVKDEFYQSLDLEDMEFNFTIFNDLSKEIRLNTGAVYVNGKPIPYMSEIPIPGRKKIELKVSNVLRDSLEFFPSVLVGEIKVGE